MQHVKYCSATISQLRIQQILTLKNLETGGLLIRFPTFGGNIIHFEDT